MIRHWWIVLLAGWTGIVVLLALALACVVEIGLAIASQPPIP